MDRLIAVLMAAAFICNLPGCLTTHPRAMAELPPSPSTKIAGFTTVDGRHHPCYCEARIEGDVLRLRPREPPEDPDAPTRDSNGAPLRKDIEPREETIATRDVVTLDVVERSGVWTGLVIIGALAMVIGLLYGIGMSSIHVLGSGPWH